ncbi:MAG: hypothetical protein Q9194_003376 [Teloschistes cf. exilis]
MPVGSKIIATGHSAWQTHTAVARWVPSASTQESAEGFWPFGSNYFYRHVPFARQWFFHFLFVSFASLSGLVYHRLCPDWDIITSKLCQILNAPSRSCSALDLSVHTSPDLQLSVPHGTGVLFGNFLVKLSSTSTVTGTQQTGHFQSLIDGLVSFPRVAWRVPRLALPSRQARFKRHHTPFQSNWLNDKSIINVCKSQHESHQDLLQLAQRHQT